MRSGELLTGLERSYYTTCKACLYGNLTTAYAWAAYTFRITAVGVLVDSGRSTGVRHGRGIDRSI